MLRMITFAALFFALGAPIALACNEPSLGSVTSRAGAGDPISFSIANLEPGAGVSLSVADREVFSGVAADRTLNGSFPLPDVDGVATVWVEARVQHDGGVWVSSRPVEVVSVAPAAAAPATAAPEHSAPAPRSAPRPEATSVPPLAAAPLVVAPRATHASARPTPRATVQRPVGSSTAALRPTSQPSHAVARSVPALRVRPSSPRSATPKPRATRRNTSQRITVPVVPRDRHAADPRPSIRAVGSGEEPPHEVILELVIWVLAGSALLLAGALACLVVVRRRRARHAAAVEAELQAMLAEARVERAWALYEHEHA